MKRILSALFLLSLSAYAAVPMQSIGDLSDRVMLPMSVLTVVLYDVSLVLGITLLVAALLRYRNYRARPGQILLREPISLLVFGLIFLILPMIAKFSESAILVSKLI